MPQTLRAPAHSELLIKKSRFIGCVQPMADRASAQAVVDALRREHPGAAHVCWALLAGGQSAAVDDGEPGGTAGRPMLDVLRHQDLEGVLATVVRYFGGVKLGAGGLVRAYGNAVSEALDRAQLVHRRALTQATIEVPHADAGRFDNLLREWVTHHDATLGETAYGQRALFEAWIPAEQLTQLTADIATWSQGTLTPAFGDTRVTDTPA
jgi:uncharacterized YigZ family protein